MDRRAFAALAVAVGLLVGFLGSVFFYDQQIGLSFPLFMSLVTAVILAMSCPAGRRLNRRNLWPLIPLLFFAAMVSARDDWMVRMLNVMAVLSLGALTLHYLIVEQPLDEDSFAAQAGSMVQAGVMVVPAALIEAGQSWAWLRENRHRRGGQVASVARGLTFAAPILLVFVFLLGSADAVFASYVNQAWDGVRRALGLELVDDTIGRIFMTITFATLATGAIGYGLKRRVTAPTPVLITEDDGEAFPIPDLKEKNKPSFKLTMIESGIILGGVALLFAAFVVIQFAYFFGGHANIGIEGLTYAQYARRGFFELVAVSGLTLGLALWLDRVTVRQGVREMTVFRALAVALVALTTVMLISAGQRMWLYEEAFGFTQLRVYTHVAIVWLGVSFGVFLLALFRIRKNVFSLGTLLVIVGYLVTINLLNVDSYIAERNIERYHQGHELDIAFLNILSADAVPVILPLYAESEPGTEVHTWSGNWLAYQLQTLEREGADDDVSVFAWNASRAHAYALLDAARDTLPEYDPRLYYRSYWSLYGEGYDEYGSGWDNVTRTP
jgi:hypothetical protein